MSSVCWGAVLNFALNLVLIPSWGVAGAAFSTLLAELLVTLYQAWYLRDQLREMVVLADLGKIGLATPSYSDTGSRHSGPWRYRPLSSA